MRSAWLSAVLSTPDVPCVHSVLDYPGVVDYEHGQADPYLACLDPEHFLEFEGPKALVRRDLEEAYRAFVAFGKKLYDAQISDAFWQVMVDNYHKCLVRTRYVVEYESLSDTQEVMKLCKHLGVRVSEPYVENMQLLHIEQALYRFTDQFPSEQP